MMTEITALAERVNSVVVCATDALGYPNAKAMFKMEREGLKTFYFSTNLSAKRSQGYLKNAKASIYLMDTETYQGLMLVGEMQVLTDTASKARLWREGNEIYYPDGIEDADYCVLRFTAHRGNYYHGLKNIDFDL